MIRVTLKLYGAMRNYESGAPIRFEIRIGANRDELRAKIIETLDVGDTELFDTCAIATDDEIIGSEFILTKDVNISILPPVCGG